MKAVGGEEENIIIVDLRGEPHAILNGAPVSVQRDTSSISLHLYDVQSWVYVCLSVSLYLNAIAHA